MKTSAVIVGHAHTPSTMPSVAQVLNAATHKIMSGNITARDFGLASLMLHAIPLSRKARKAAGADLGSLRLLWVIAGAKADPVV